MEKIIEELKTILERKLSNENSKFFTFCYDPNRFKEKFSGADAVVRYEKTGTTIGFTSEVLDSIINPKDLTEIMGYFLDNFDCRFYVSTRGKNGYKIKKI